MSDVRQEAVKQALEQFGARPIPSSKRILNAQTKRTNISFILLIFVFFHSGDSTDDDEDDDDDESSSTYADEQHNKESSISPIPTSFQNHHYQNPPTVESILKSNQTLQILFVRANLILFVDIQAPPLPSTFLSDFIHRSQEPSRKSLQKGNKTVFFLSFHYQFDPK